MAAWNSHLPRQIDWGRASNRRSGPQTVGVAPGQNQDQRCGPSSARGSEGWAFGALRVRAAARRCLHPAHRLRHAPPGSGEQDHDGTDDHHQDGVIPAERVDDVIRQRRREDERLVELRYLWPRMTATERRTAAQMTCEPIAADLRTGVVEAIRPRPAFEPLFRSIAGEEGGVVTFCQWRPRPDSNRRSPP